MLRIKHLFLLGALIAGATSCTVLPSNSPLFVTKTDAPIRMKSAPISHTQILSRIGFGSCLKEKDNLDILSDIQMHDPELFILLGDNVYGDLYPYHPQFGDKSLPKMKASYAELAARPEFTAFRQNTPLLTTWDDHDFGVNDGGASFIHKQSAQALFLEAWDVPDNDPRQTRDGIYTSQTFGPDGQRVQIILLDTRYFRGELTPTDERDAPGKERYLPATNTTSTMLGERQWAWLEHTLQEPADVRFLVSSLQVIATGHGWEAWNNLPHERQRLFDMLETTRASTNTLIISGDRHSGALYEFESSSGTLFREMTTSSLNAPLSGWFKPEDIRPEAGPNRLTDMQNDANYGIADIDWVNKTVTLSLHSPDNPTDEMIVAIGTQ